MGRALLVCLLAVALCGEAHAWTNHRLSPVDQDVVEASLGGGGEGRSVVAWIAREAGGGMGMWARRREADGALGAAERLGDADAMGGVAVDPATGDAIVAWSSHAGVHAAVLPAGDSEFGSEMALGEGAGPVAVTAGAGRATVVWIDERVMVARAVLADGRWDSQPVSEPVGALYDGRPPELEIAPAAAGGATVAWISGEGGETASVRSVSVPAVGDPGDELTLSDPQRSASGLALAGSALHGALAAWVDAQEGWFSGPVAAATRDVLDDEWSAPAHLGGWSGATIGLYAQNPDAAAAVGPGGRALVAWDRAEGGTENSFSSAPAVAVTGPAGGQPAFSSPHSLTDVFAREGPAVAVGAQDGLWVATGSGFQMGLRVVAGTPGGWSAAEVAGCATDTAQAHRLSIGPAGTPLVLWRHANPARDRRGLFLAVPGPTATEPCPPLRGPATATPAVPRAGGEVVLDASPAIDAEAGRYELEWRIDGEEIPAADGEPILRRTFTEGHHSVDVWVDFWSDRGEGYGSGMGMSLYVCPAAGCPVYAPPPPRPMPWSWPPPPPQRPPAPPPPPPPAPAALRVAAPHRVRAGSLARGRGLPFTLTSTRTTVVRVSLRLRGQSLASRRVAAVAGRSVTGRLVVRWRARARLRRRPPRALTLLVDPAGSRLETLRTRVRLRG